MQDKRSIIEDIRRQHTGLGEIPRTSLLNSISNLADDLYSKDAHFIFELIQNAEDNSYNNKTPFLHFQLTQTKINNKSILSLHIENNEIGFLEENIVALCSVGKSTKKKSDGYIGEKGIGFKSVFKITDCPYIFSNGFCFSLPKLDRETELGYIIPNWVDLYPKSLNNKNTNIILPLKRGEINSKKINEYLHDISPETILFLHKLKTIEIKIDINDSYEIIFEKEDKKFPQVDLTYCKINEEKEDDKTLSYWISKRSFPKPPHINPEKRNGIDNREVSIAISLDNHDNIGKLFAYLPVMDDTGIPFLINADFLLSSSREGLKEDESWNQWLRDCIPEVYSEAFISCLENLEISFEQKINLYKSIPIESHYIFLQPIIKKIYAKLKMQKCILTTPGNTLVQPVNAIFLGDKYHNLIDAKNELPSYLRTEKHLICAELEQYGDILTKIGVTHLSLTDFIRCLDDSEWLRDKDDEWLIELFRLLLTQNINKHILCSKRFLPVNRLGSESAEMICRNDLPVFLSLDSKASESLKNAPNCLKKIIPIAFLKGSLPNLFNKQGDGYKIKAWMRDCLNVKEFSLSSYCSIIIEELKKKYREIDDDDDLIEITSFLFSSAPSYFHQWNDLPVILNDGQRFLVSEISPNIPLHPHHLKNWNPGIQSVVVHQSFDFESGWQHIWSSEKDRRHFAVLSEKYNNILNDNILKKLKISRYPMPIKTVSKYQRSGMCRGYWQDYNQEEHDFLSPSWMNKKNIEITNNQANALIGWLRAYEDLLGTHFIFTQEKLPIDGRFTIPDRLSGEADFITKLRKLNWLPTTSKGLVSPSQAFLPRDSIKEIMGNTVPYFNGDLSKEIRDFLGIKKELTTDILIETLKECSNDTNTNPEMVKRIYHQLNTRSHHLENNFSKVFQDHPLIFIPGNEKNSWYKADNCIWEDSSKIFGDKFVCLEKQYPSLKPFFLNVLNVKEKVDTESYALQWLKLQEEEISDYNSLRQNLESIYKKILPITKQDKEKWPEWWSEIASDIKVFTQNKTFEEPHQVVVPDDGELKRIFKDSSIHFAWRPEKDSFSDYEPFYNALNIPKISEIVTHRLVESDAVTESVVKNRYLTTAAIEMIASYIRNTDKKLYEELSGNNIFKLLFETKEARIEKNIRINFECRPFWEEKEVEYPIYWHKQEKLLILSNIEDQDTLKQKIARFIAKELTNSRGYKSVEDWIELTLSSEDIDRLDDKGWNVPIEISALIREFDNNNSTVQNNFKPKDEKNIQPIKSELNQEEKTNNSSHEQISSKNDNVTKPENARQSLQDIDSQQIPNEEYQHSTNAKVEQEDLLIPTQLNTNKETNQKSQHFDPGSRHYRSSNLKRKDETEKQPEIENHTKDHQKSDFENTMLSTGQELLTQRFNRPGKTNISEKYKDIDYYSTGKVKNSVLRRVHSKNTHRRNINSEPPRDERRKETVRTILEPPSPETRGFLENLYGGKCQICQKTFPERDGKPFFIASHIIERKHGRFLDNYANALCLCPEHFAKWCHGSVEAPDIDELIMSFKTEAEGGDGNRKISVKLCGENCQIIYKEKHLLDLQELLRELSREDKIK